jgi:hypothetical protein
MISQTQLKESIHFISLSLLAVLILCTIMPDRTDARTKPPRPARSGTHTPIPAISPVETTTATRPVDSLVVSPCVPIEVAVFKNRIHVRCASAAAGIDFFAVPSIDADFLNRTLSVLTAAQIANRTLAITFDVLDLSGIGYGCQVNDCRPLQAVSFGQ